jgi:tRNA pseudouridine55 synthase
VGKATRLVRFLAEGDKVYRATVRLGFATSTDDLLGEPLGPEVPVSVDLEAVRAACRPLTGRLQQAPPAYSAKRIAGRRAYDLAREGVAVAPLPVPVVVHAFEVLGLDAARVEIEVRCSPGTYIRALARDLGAALGVGGHLIALRRLRSSSFDLSSAVGWDELPAVARERVTPLSGVLTELPSVSVGAEGLTALRHGRALTPALVREGFPGAPPPDRLRILDQSGALVALAVPRGFGVSAPGLSVAPTLHPDIVLLDDVTTSNG